MSVDPTTPPAVDVDTVLHRLRISRSRLAEMGTESAAEALARAVDEVGEDLLVADEELRVQAEHLERSTRQLDTLVAAYEELFANAPTAYLQTDADGLVLRMNRAAARLLGQSAVAKRSRTLAGLVRSADRGTVRQVLTRLRAGDGRSTAASHEPLEVAIVRSDGSEVPVVLTGRRSPDVDAKRTIVHWELQARVGAEATAPRRLLHRGSAPAVLEVARAVTDLARQSCAADCLRTMVSQSRQLVPAAEAVGAAVIRARGRIDDTASTSELAAAADAVQYERREGPGSTALDENVVVPVADFAADTRWPRFSAWAVRTGIRAAIAVPLVGHRGSVGVLTLYSRRPHAFQPDDVVVIGAYAKHAGIAYSRIELEENLRVGLATREEIGRAVGIMMERHRITASAAFDMLVLASQQSHRKLREIAALIAETGQDPMSAVERG